MPKEQIRKRGRRKPKQNQDGDDRPAAAQQAENFTEATEQQNEAGPSSIHPARAAMLAGRKPSPMSYPQRDAAQGGDDQEQTLEWGRDLREAEFPFGVLDPDLKAYFRNVDDQIRDWEGVSTAGEEREDRQNFLNNVLSELRGHELEVATDPDTALVLERLMPSLNDWGRRVIGDAFGDQWEILLRHRFGSHVAQTWFNLAAHTLDREARGIYPPQQNQGNHKGNDEAGSLPTIATLFSTILNILRPTIPSLLTNPHASPPLRLLLLVCTPCRPLPDLATSSASKGDLIRSKRSGKYRKGHGVQGKSILGEDSAKDKEANEKFAKERRVPSEVVDLRKDVTGSLRDSVSEVEWRSMGVNEVGSAAVQLLVDLEVEDGRAETQGSLLDVLTEGLVSEISDSSKPSAREYPASLLTFPIGTRVFESLLRISPQAVFTSLWTLYFEGKIGKLAVHPYANFVVAAGVARLDAKGIERAARECKAVSGGKSIIKTARTSVLQALISRAIEINDCAEGVMELIASALDLPPKEKKLLVPCLMAMKTLPVYDAIKTGAELPADEPEEVIPDEVVDQDAEAAAAAAARLEGWKNRRNPKPRQDDLAPHMQGSLLLQAMVKVQGQFAVVIDSLLAQEQATLLDYACHPISSRFIESIYSSPVVTPPFRRKVTMAYLERFKTLAEDKSGSWIAETMWSKADGYMKEKIARSLIPHANALAGSQYGRFLYNKLQLHRLQRAPREWREAMIAKPKPVEAPVPTGESEAPVEGKKEKKRRKEKDEIDLLFAGVKKQKVEV